MNTDSVFRTLCLGCACLIGALTLGFFVQLLVNSGEAWSRFGVGFLWSSEWDPVAGKFGALPSVAGTLLTTCIALAVALPLAFVSALFLTDAPPALSRVLSHAIDLLAAIPSVIYGMWGLFVLAPLMQNHVQPFLAGTLHLRDVPALGALLVGDAGFNGFGFFTAGLILALMILPYVCAIMRDVFRMTPAVLRESAFGIGCTKWECARDIVMKFGMRGLLGGVFVGLGRALGETMAVLFVIGNLMDVPAALFDSGTTIAATLANNFAEADGLQRSALFALGLILLAMAFAVQIFAQYYLSLTSSKRGEAR